MFRGHDLSEEDKMLRRHILNLMTRFETPGKVLSSTCHISTAWQLGSKKPQRDDWSVIGEALRDHE